MEHISRLISDWKEKTDPAFVKELGMDDPQGSHDIAKKIVQSMYSPWFNYFLAYDPGPYLEKLTGKVLALNGEKDIQVISKQNLPGIEASLKKSKVTKYNVLELPGLNHLFQTCKKCTVEEYGELEESFSPTALKIIGDWLESNVK